MKAIILAGGLGERLRPSLHDQPKPMAPIEDKPFLAYLIDYLHRQGITSVILTVHYMREKIQTYFQERYSDIEIQYAIESEPLGTGGAVVNALNQNKVTEPVFVIHGASLVKLNYQAMYDQHLKQGSALTLSLRPLSDCSRFGQVITDNYHVVDFKDHDVSGPGYIYAGVYLINPSLFSHYDLPKSFSIEKDFLPMYLHELKPHVFIANDFFIDIAIPEEYARARTELIALLKV